jgi:hypothetical protein
MSKFRKKPVVIDAVEWTGKNGREVGTFLEDATWRTEGVRIVIETLEDEVTASPGWWIIKGAHGEFCTCKSAVFEATYEPVEEPVPA